MQLFRRVGVQLLRKAQKQLASGIAPDRTLAEGLLLIASALLLMLPCYFSDALGVLILILRVPLAALLLGLFKRNLANGRIYVKTWSSSPSPGATRPQAERLGETVIIDVEPLEKP